MRSKVIIGKGWYPHEEQSDYESLVDDMLVNKLREIFDNISINYKLTNKHYGVNGGRYYG